MVYKAKIHNDETTIWFDFKCDDKLKNTARIVSPHPDLFDAKITPFSESDHPLYGRPLFFPWRHPIYAKASI